MNYPTFLRRNYQFLSFGFLLVFVGNYGQTFFLSVFGTSWRETFQLSHTELGSFYSAATMISGFTIMLIGGLIDKISLKRFTLWVMLGVFAASITLATSVNVWFLALGFFLIRLCGQGLSTHTAFTSMAKYFDKNRGKAISVAAMGMPVGEFVLPLLAAFAIVTIGWRTTWWILAFALIVLFLPLLLWSLRDENRQQPVEHSTKDDDKHSNLEQNSQTESDDSTTSLPSSHWDRSRVIRDFRFWLAIPAILSPAVIITGVFFHQTYWGEVRDWSITAIASSLSLYAITHAIGSLYTGTLVDRFGAQRIMRTYLLPLGVGLLFLQWPHYGGWLVFMALSGLSVGASGPTVGALWPEVYGTRYLGAIRALVSALMVVSTALAPVVLGLMIDDHWSMSWIMGALFGYSLLAIAICQRVYRQSIVLESTKHQSQ